LFFDSYRAAEEQKDADEPLVGVESAI